MSGMKERGPMDEVLVHFDVDSPRARYIARHLLEGILGLRMRTAASTEEFRSAQGPRLAYGRQVFVGALLVPESGGLARTSPPQGVVEGPDGPHIFPTAGGHDVFASAFHLLSLADEIGRTERDVHGRVRSDALFVVRHGLADRPWVDHWAIELGERLRMQWPGLVLRPRAYRHVLTVDMDNVLRHVGRPLHRALGATAKDMLGGRFGAVVDRWRDRLTGHDPYLAVLDRVQEQRAHVDDAILFMLLRGDGAHDHSVPPQRWPASVRARFAAFTAARTGLHPAYHATDVHAQWAEEARVLRAIIPTPVTASRHHYLRWAPPQSLRTAQELGFTEEHSLGFADRAGFRASTCTPFPWYDLEQERATDLMIHPFAVMDSALIERVGLEPDDVVRTMQVYSDRVRDVGGTFISVWHDRYLSGYREFRPWPAVLDRVVQLAKP
jgi:hypothetical protein